MGQAMSYGLTQHDVDELIKSCDGVFNQPEVESLYRRFRALDRGRKGYITADEFLAIPELSINPLAQRLVRLYEAVNFKEFVRLLAPFSARASPDLKLHYIFEVYDVDGDGLVSRDDMGIMLRQLAGSTLSDDDIQALIDQALAAAQSPNGLTYAAIKAAIAHPDLSCMQVEIPLEL